MCYIICYFFVLIWIEGDKDCERNIEGFDLKINNEEIRKPNLQKKLNFLWNSESKTLKLKIQLTVTLLFDWWKDWMIINNKMKLYL